MHLVAIRTCFIGYMPTTRQYRLYDPVKKAILISTAPQFIENKRLEINWKGIDPSLEIKPFEPAEMEINIPQLTQNKVINCRKSTRRVPPATRKKYILVTQREG